MPTLRQVMRYEYRMVAILCVTFGILTTEIFAPGFLAPFIAKDLHLGPARIGEILAAFWVTYAISSFLTGLIAARSARLKVVLVLTLVLIALGSILSALANSFLTLLGVRMLMGLLIGPFLPVAQTLIALESPAGRLGLYTGILQSLGNNILAVFLAPTLIVFLAAHFGWRAGFCVVIAPGLICAALVAGLLREPSRGDSAHQVEESTPLAGIIALYRLRNMWVCGLGSILLMAFITVTMGFTPQFLLDVRRLNVGQMSGFMSVLGVAGAALGVALPALSDRWGRRPVMILSCALGVLAPLAAMSFSMPLAACGIFLFFGWAAAGATPLFLTIVPAESVPKPLISAVVGVNIAAATLVGGVGGPALAGWMAENGGPYRPVAIQFGCVLCAALLALLVKETAPHVRGRSVASVPRS